jgi:hypothetical protein
MCKVGREPRRVGAKSCAWAVDAQLGIRRVTAVEDGQGRKERLRAGGCPGKAGLVP